jgi:hypothetical protein
LPRCPPVLPPNGVRHQPQIPYSTGLLKARPRGFEPLTFGSVADAYSRDLALASRILRTKSPGSRQKIRIAARLSGERPGGERPSHPRKLPALWADTLALRGEQARVRRRRGRLNDAHPRVRQQSRACRALRRRRSRLTQARLHPLSMSPWSGPTLWFTGPDGDERDPGFEAGLRSIMAPAGRHTWFGTSQ